MNGKGGYEYKQGNMPTKTSQINKRVQIED